MKTKKNRMQSFTSTIYFLKLSNIMYIKHYSYSHILRDFHLDGIQLIYYN